MELRQLRHFDAVMRTGGFGLAAEHLNMSQPALSKSIRTLETSLGVRLFDRGPGGIRPTLYGERLRDYARSVLMLTEEARLELDAMRGARRGRLNIGAITTVQRSLLPQAIRRFHKTHPEVDIRVNEELNQVLHEMLCAGQIDIAIVSRPEQPLQDEMRIRLLASTPIVLAVDAGHPLARRDEVGLADLVPYAWILPPRPEPDRLRLEAMFAAESLPPPMVRIETTSAVFQTSLLAGTDCLTYMTRTSHFLQQNGGAFVALRLNRDTWQREMCAIYRKTGTLRPTIAAFLQELDRVGTSLDTPPKS